MSSPTVPPKIPALVIDDDPDFLALIRTHLSALGFEAEGTTTPVDFLKKFRMTPPKACFIDLHLGSALMGFELVTAVRQQFQSSIPIFVVSAENDSRVVAHAIESGATDYIVKPIELALLASKLSPYFSSNEIAGSRLPFFPVDKDDGVATLTADFSLHKVNEQGITLLSRNLISKGCVVRVQSPVFEALGGKGDSLLVTVSNTWIESGAQPYAIYAEFDATDDALMTSVRRWLTAHHAKAGIGL